ncbi:MAG: hypothetical protein KAQ92_06305, partial [Candidatus Aenigmarchaeota archaeon]|nr:hypothetical protein [Candidatus Aenigmarchaeota archaeon]
SDSADILFKRRKLVSKDGKVIVVSKDERIMLNTIMSSYFIGYLSNRNFKEIVNDIIEENDKQLEKFFFKLILTLIQEIRKSSQKVDNYLYNLITEIQYTIQKYHPDDSKLKTLFENFKNKISKNPNINLRISDEESMSIHSDEERQTPDQTSDAIQKQKAEITQQLKIIKEELNELKKLSEQKDQ